MRKLNIDVLRHIIKEELQIGSQHALALGTANLPPRPDLRDDLRGSHETGLIENLINSCKAYLVAGNAEGAAGHVRQAARAYSMHYGEGGGGAENIFGNARLAEQVLHIVHNIGDVMTRRKDVLERLVHALEQASSKINLGDAQHVHPSTYIAESMPEIDLQEAPDNKFEEWPQAPVLTQTQIMQLLSAVNSMPPEPVAGPNTWNPSAPLTPADRKQLTAALQALSRTAPK